mmetsp:Transcript_41966/g.100888  ORF Transcript_41966/g.100888 Transcript_41966/m.100888 type:complete len:210 (-) Transcript_41966:205-834(-)
MSSHLAPLVSMSELLHLPGPKDKLHPSKAGPPYTMVSHCVQSLLSPVHSSEVAGFSPAHLGPMQSTARVRVPGPHLALQEDQGPGTQWQPVVSTHSSTASGLLRVRQSSSWPVLHSTLREWVPLPQAVEHAPQLPVCHLASPSWALPELPTTPSFGGRVGTSSSHFGGFSHTILQSGFGHSLGFWHFQSQTGSGQIVLHFKASLHKKRH